MRHLVRHPADRPTALRLVQAVHPNARLEGTTFYVEDQVIGRLEEDGAGALRLIFSETQELNG